MLSSAAATRVDPQLRFKEQFPRDRRRRRGSLPFKKRRVVLVNHGFETTEQHSFAPLDVENVGGNLKMEAPTSLDFCKMTALSLIATAAASETSRDAMSTCRPAAMPPQTALNNNPEQDDHDMSSDDGDDDDLTSGMSNDNQQKHPLPGACHGKTSRNNSFCRRQPCYNNSTFCKLHYQQQQQHLKSTQRLQTVTSPSTPKSTPPAVGQDKRHSSLDSSIAHRCLATTTRGRACAYIAVVDTKYCFLHADYDTNPPPRRKSKDEDDDEEDEADEQQQQQKQRVSSPDVPDKGAAITSAKRRFRRTSAKLAEKHADSPYPLLSMIATDQWFGRTVKIAMGPLEGRTGVVEKWGNGWISVSVPGVGLHNRRSFELYLEDEPVDDVAQVDEDDDDAKVAAPGESAQNQPLFRCVSRDVVSPSPSTDGSIKSRSSGAARAVTPKVSRSPPLVLQSTTMLSPRRNNEVKGTATPGLLPPTTPRPLIRVAGGLLDGTETPVPTKLTAEYFKCPAPKVTPFTEKSTARPRIPMTDVQSAAHDLQLPDDSDKNSSSSGASTIASAMIFRPSVGERTRGRASSSSEDDDTAAASVQPAKANHLYLGETFSLCSTD